MGTPIKGGNRSSTSLKLSMLRRKVSERLVSVKNETAMLTTFNEVNMENVISIRAKYKEYFLKSTMLNLVLCHFLQKHV